MRRALLACLALTACRTPPAPAPLVVAYPSGPDSLVPDRANEEFTISILSNVFETLVDFDTTLALTPGLAESWYTADDRTWVFKLAPGVHFHDGTLLEARDVAARLEAARSDPASKRRGELAVIDAIRAQDPLSVEVHTRAPFAAVAHRLANVAIWKPAADGTPVGTGPYRVESWTARGDTRLVAFDDHHAGAPEIRNVEFRAIPDGAERLTRLREGSVQLVLDVPSEAIPELEGRGVRVIAEKGLRVLFLAMDVRTPPFADIRLRQAVAAAVDRDALVRGPLGGYAEVVDQVVAAPVAGYDPHLKGYPHDPAQARRLVAELPEPTSRELQLDYMPTKYRAMPAVVAALRADLAAVGLHVTPRPFEVGDLIARIERHEPRFYLWGWISTGGDAVVSYNYLLRTPRDGFGLDNGGSYSNPDVDRLLEEAAGAMDRGRRQSLMVEVARHVHQDVAVVPLYRQTDLYGVARGLEFRPHADRRIRAAEIHWHAE